jgi:hypothetical protein
MIKAFISSTTLLKFLHHFLLRHTTLTIYYPQGNGQAESTNKIIGLLFIKFVDGNYIDWDEHLDTILHVYFTTFKVL